MSLQNLLADASTVQPKNKILILIQGDSQEFSDILLSLQGSFDCILEGRDRIGNDFQSCECALIFPLSKQNDLQFIRTAKQKYDSKPCYLYLPRKTTISIDDLLAVGMRDITVLSCDRSDISSNLNKLLSARKNAEFARNLLLSFSRQFLVGKSRAFVAALDNILKVSNVHSPVLITGETGTGKELFARAVHYLSQRSGNAFIPLNCGALHEHLFENELFGHVKGAYTGAGDSREGVVNDARGGTLFLDEINTLSTLSQVKLLRFLEDKTYRKLGSSNVVEADIRIVSATNANLDDAVKADKFREDLLYRINALTIELPPLRDRNGDIPLLADHFLRQFCLENERPSIYVSDAALKKLSSWRWPGNVRELKNVVNKAAVMCNSNIIRDADICVGSIREDNASGFTYKQAKDRTLERFEKEYVAKLLNMSAWNISQASKSAQMSRQSFYRLIKKHNIPIQEEGSVTSVIR